MVMRLLLEQGDIIPNVLLGGRAVFLFAAKCGSESAMKLLPGCVRANLDLLNNDS